MTISVLSAARYLCEKSDWTLTNLKLQKLVYLAHMLHMGEVGQGNGLIAEPFEAWDYGPVSPDLYRHVKAFGSSPVRNVFHSVKNPTDPLAIKTLDSVYEDVGGLSAGRLVQITHRKDGAWDKHYVPGLMGVEISNESIKREYDERLQRAQERARERV